MNKCSWRQCLGIWKIRCNDSRVLEIRVLLEHFREKEKKTQKREKLNCQMREQCNQTPSMSHSPSFWILRRILCHTQMTCNKLNVNNYKCKSNLWKLINWTTQMWRQTKTFLFIISSGVFGKILRFLSINLMWEKHKIEWWEKLYIKFHRIYIW